MRCTTVARAIPIVAGLAAASLQAQEPPKGPEPLQVGVVAPDFTLPGATRYGTLKTPIHLSDFKGKTVVLAFFYKARTKG
jgi:cytochrome oxidase Cu insertion factor (SCO1/SenC/PrrC family)